MKDNSWILCALLVVMVRCATYYRLQTTGQKNMKVGDSLVSTLGLIKITLQEAGCTLTFSEFDEQNNTYKFMGNYTSQTAKANCQSITIVDGKLVTNNGAEFMVVNTTAYNRSTYFNVDDQGLLRLIATSNNALLSEIYSEQTVIDWFRTQRTYLRAYSHGLEVNFMDSSPIVVNERDWKFSYSSGQLDIIHEQQNSLQYHYTFNFLRVNNTQIKDFNSRTLPRTIFTDVKFQPRCFEPTKFLDFRAPYLFTMDPYWPTVTVYEQGGYKLAELSLGKFHQINHQQDISELNFNPYFSPCPPRTFQYRGQCVGTCPTPYFHQIRGETGKCVLTCEQFSQVNTDTRVCSCVTDYVFARVAPSNLVKSCPGGQSVKTPFGCDCTNSGAYFDSQVTLTCVRASGCPPATFAANGLCMDCPHHCKNCTRDQYNRMYLKCEECQEGYTVYNGQCERQCNTNKGNSIINGVCTPCADPNCVDCSTDASVCRKCNIITSLSNGQCVDNCTLPTFAVYSEFFSTHCLTPSNLSLLAETFLKSHYQNIPFLKCDTCPENLIAHLDGCVSNCPPGYYAHNNQYCACQGDKLTINNQCVDLPACPITMYFDILSHSCLSCPFGCLTCFGRTCTSCNPGYFLMTYPLGIHCFRKSPLSSCENRYRWIGNNTCMLIDLNNLGVDMQLCSQNVPRCRLCQAQSSTVCAVCQEGYQLYNNTCLEQCPDFLIPYDNVCILPEINNCSMPYLMSIHQATQVKKLVLDVSESYLHYLYASGQNQNTKQQSNDPVGYIPFSQDIETDNIPRQTNFFEPVWTCIRCADGFGLTNDSKGCLPCPAQCSENRCYRARNDSCIGGFEKQCGINQYKDSETRECLESCNEEDKYPQIIDGQLYCTSKVQGYLKIDSAVYQSEDEDAKTVFFVFSNKIVANDEKVSIELLGGRQRRTLKRGLNIVGQSEEQIPTEAKIQNGEYILIDQSKLGSTYEGYKINLTNSILQLKSKEGEIPPNLVYGSLANNDHRVFMKVWLAYIGYLMSIIILLLHAMFIGNELLYKMDNLIIFVQSIYFFSFVKNLVGSNLAQFYYGWFFMHAGFLPNIFSSVIPDEYMELSAPPSFKLVNMDGNYFRNAGFSLGWLLIFIGVHLFISFIIWAIVFRIKKKKESWYFGIAKQSLAAGFEFFSMNLIFFSLTQLHYSYNHTYTADEFFERSQAMAIITLVVYSIYTILKLLFSPLGGIYMLKRFSLCLCLAFSYNINLVVIAVVGVELLFIILRFKVENPGKGPQKGTIVGEAVFLCGAYLLLFLCFDSGVNTVIISSIIFIFMVYLSYDLTTIYLESRDEFPESQIEKDYDQAYYESERQKMLSYESRRQSSVSSKWN